MKATIGGKGASMLYMLSAAIHPRFLMTVDDSGALLPVPVRVGQAVDVVAQAGRPKSITGTWLPQASTPCAHLDSCT